MIVSFGVAIGGVAGTVGMAVGVANSAVGGSVDTVAACGVVCLLRAPACFSTAPQAARSMIQAAQSHHWLIWPMREVDLLVLLGSASML